MTTRSRLWVSLVVSRPNKPMQQVAEHFLILGLTSCASQAELKSAYRREMLKWHPDRYFGDPSMQPKATERAKCINAAYESLSEQFEIGCFPRTVSPRSSRPQPTYRTRHSYNGQPFTPGFSDPDVFEVFVKSSHIISAGYSRAKRILYIKFVGNRVYRYQDVPESVFTAFIAAESHGRFAHRHIYSHYRYVQCKNDA